MVVQWLSLCTSNMAGMGSNLAEELRSHTPCPEAWLRKKENTTNTIIKQGGVQ